MSAGELRESVAFDKIAPAADDGGTVAGAWTEQFRERAGFTVLVGSEPVIQQRLQGVQPVVVKVRSNSNTRLVDASWRIRDVNAGTAYNIRAVTPTSPRREYIDFLCDAGVAD
jgi:head-tail adaptor